MIGVYMEGGLCNRLFQLAFAFSFAKKNVVTFKIEGWKTRTHHSCEVYEWLIERFMELSNYEKKEINYYREKFTEGYEDYSDYYPPTINRYSDVFIRGFFQNENYFIEYRDDILDLFRPPDEIIQQIENSKYYPYLNNAYFLHIRLGDYVNDCNKKHWIDLEHYYNTTLSQIEPTATILIFSNFPEHIEKYYPNIFTINDFIIVEEPDEVFNLYLMSLCKKGGICANSSFSWWGSWLNKDEDKKVFMPDKWMNGFDRPPNIHPSYATIIKTI